MNILAYIFIGLFLLFAYIVPLVATMWMYRELKRISGYKPDLMEYALAIIPFMNIAVVSAVAFVCRTAIEEAQAEPPPVREFTAEDIKNGSLK